ncbi:MAG: PD-(D/E)XK nuclease family protein [Anaerolineae bacterium]
MAVEVEQEVITLIRQKLPELVRSDPEIRAWVLEIAGERFADRAQTEDRFEKMLAELRRDREEWNRRWEEQRAEWERRWEESERRWAEWERRWEEQRAESERRWQENQEVIRKLTQRIDTGIKAIGARWGIFAESAFRNGIRAILEESFGVRVFRYQEYDHTGEVFGHPDQVELDLIVQDSILLVCEIKSSMSRSDMYTFDRKVHFYERTAGRRADRKIVISPMVEEQAFRVARQLGIEVYTHADEVPL